MVTCQRTAQVSEIRGESVMSRIETGLLATAKSGNTSGTHGRQTPAISGNLHQRL
jgi:hypothetical protein